MRLGQRVRSPSSGHGWRRGYHADKGSDVPVPGKEIQSEKNLSVAFRKLDFQIQLGKNLNVKKDH